jgi:dihydrolipoamide dehydrogenase
MKQYDMLVLGSGAGANVASDAYEQGMTVAIVDNDRFGGTCLNRGCIPTKILTYVADLIMEIRNAERVNLKANVEEVDFSALMTRMRHETWDESEEMERSFGKVEGYDFYKGTGEFVGPYTMDVNNERIKAQHVVIASGARPVIPNVPGLEKVQYFTNKTILEVDDIPKSMIIIGGGFIAVEFGHFFSAIGTEVTILQRAPSLIVQEDNDVSELLRSELSKRMRILLNNEVVAVGEAGGLKTVTSLDHESGAKKDFKAETLLVAAGRRSNADLFKPEKTGVKVDKDGWVIVDDYFRTSQKNIWAFGDALGRQMFRHVANQQSGIVWHNISETIKPAEGRVPKLAKMDYHAIPRAVFTYPAIATVGMTLQDAKQSGRPLLVGKADYTSVAKGIAMGNPQGFVRVICDAEQGAILGATIIGPEAPTLIQEITNLMNSGNGDFYPMFGAIHIHPALNEVVQRAFGALAPIDHEHTHQH